MVPNDFIPDPLAAWNDGYQKGKAETLERMRAMRIDYQNMPHAEFPIKWPDWRDYKEVLPSYCGCKDCRLWRSGS